jgi:hypothetical protein
MTTQESGLVVGYTTQDHLLIDLDNSSLWKARIIAKEIMAEWPYVGDCLIVESSDKNHHLIFDNKMPWFQISHIIMTLAGLDIVELNFAWVRELRHDLTLRISPKHYISRVSPAPRIRGYLINKWFVDCPQYGIQKYLSALQAFIS